MGINVFEGARRIALLAGGVWTAACAWFLIFEQPDYVSANFVIHGPNAAPVRGSCGDDFSNTEREYKTVTTGTGRKVSITFCFPPRDFDGRQLIPFRVDEKGIVWGNTRFSDAVSEYTKRVSRNFQLKESDETWIDDLLLSQRWKYTGEVLRNWIIGVAVLWVFTRLTGWIVRGFAGIPSGRDGRS